MSPAADAHAILPLKQSDQTGDLALTKVGNLLTLVGFQSNVMGSNHLIKSRIHGV